MSGPSPHINPSELKHMRPEVEVLSNFALTVDYGRPILDLCDYIIDLEEQFAAAQGSSETMGRALAAAHTKITGLEEQLEAAQRQYAISEYGKLEDENVRVKERVENALSFLRGLNDEADEALLRMRIDRARECLEDSNPANSREALHDTRAEDFARRYLRDEDYPDGPEGCPAASAPASRPESPCAICRSYGHFTHNHPEGYVNPMYDALDPPSRQSDD